MSEHVMKKNEMSKTGLVDCTVRERILGNTAIEKTVIVIPQSSINWLSRLNFMLDQLLRLKPFALLPLLHFHSLTLEQKMARATLLCSVVVQSRCGGEARSRLRRKGILINSSKVADCTWEMQLRSEWGLDFKTLL